jgi:hypothetical protein
MPFATSEWYCVTVPRGSETEPPDFCARSIALRTVSAAACAAPADSSARPRITWPAGSASGAGTESTAASKSISPSDQFAGSCGTYATSQSRCNGTQGRAGGATAIGQGSQPAMPLFAASGARSRFGRGRPPDGLLDQ